MLEKPVLDETKLIAALQNAYGIAVAAIEFLPVGNDADAWAYQVVGADGRPYFLKLRRGALYEASLAIPRYLNSAGIAQVVAPLPALDGALSMRMDDFHLILYPFIAGRPGMEIGLSDQQWAELGTVLKAIHTTTLPDELRDQIRNEDFHPRWHEAVRRLQAKIDTGPYEDEFQQELAAFWKEKQDHINRVMKHLYSLGQQLQAQSPSLVLCHADIHTANILLDDAGAMSIVDWDGIILAPAERDLMFIGDNESFFRGYGRAAVNPVAMAYYRYEWVAQEIGDYGERVFFTIDAGEETRHDAVRGFRQLFDPGDVVDAAYQTGE